MTKPEFGRTRIRAMTRTGPVEGIFVEERRVRFGAGPENLIPHYRITDGRGTFWLVPVAGASQVEDVPPSSLPGRREILVALLLSIRRFLEVAGSDGEAPTKALEDVMDRGKEALYAFRNLIE